MWWERVILVSYNAAGELVSDPFGRKPTFSYSTSGHIATLPDPAEGVYRYRYDANDNLASVLISNLKELSRWGRMG